MWGTFAAGRDPFLYVRELVNLFSGTDGLRATSPWKHDPATVAVTAQWLDAEPPASEYIAAVMQMARAQRTSLLCVPRATPPGLTP